MKNTILIHGAPYEEDFRNPEKPSPSNSNWFPWLQKKLALRDEISVAPEMPRPYDPIFSQWLEVVNNFKINEETILVGHSCGAGFLLRFLSENKNLKPKKVILVAPWLDPEPHELSTPFFDFEIDRDLSNRTEIHLFISRDDFDSCLKSCDLIKEKLPQINYHEFADRGHFSDKEFLELIEIL